MVVYNINSMYKNVDLKEQAYKLIKSYAYSSPKVRVKLTNKEEYEDFISYAYLDFLERFLSKYDNTKSNLSTYIYKIIDYNAAIYITQTKCNVSINTARVINNNSGCSDSIKEDARKIYMWAESVDPCTGAIISNIINNDNESLEIQDKALTAPDDYKNFEEHEMNNYLKSILDDCIDRFSKRVNKNNKERNRDIIYNFLFSSNTPSIKVQNLVKKHGISRQRIHQIWHKFCNYAFYQKDLREFLEVEKRFKNEAC